METDGGGWTLVWSFTFHRYHSNFDSRGNYVKPLPKNLYTQTNLPISDTLPKSETDFNALNFDSWKLFGKDFLIKSTINNWVSCVPGTGSLVTKTLGSLSCKFIKQIVTEKPSCVSVPEKLGLIPYGWTLASSDGKLMYYFEQSNSTGNWPTHDPCVQGGPNQKKNVKNPHTNIYIG